MDEHISEYVELLWEDGEPRCWAETTLSGFTRLVPSLRGAFPCSWALIATWQRHEIPQRCTPMTLSLLHVFCGACIQRGWLDLSLTLAIGFHCILRTMEMYHIAAKDFEFSSSLDTAVLTLPHTKAGTRYNIIESVTLTDACLVRAIHTFLRNAQPGDLLFPEGAWSFRTRFDALVEKVKLPSTLLYKPYSIRRGCCHGRFPFSW